MIYLFFLYSLVPGFLFAISPYFHKPLQQGLSFLALFLSYFYFKSRNADQTSKLASRLNHIFPILTGVKIESTLILISIAFFGIMLSFHAYEISHYYSEIFLFQDADYVGMDEVIRSLLRGEGFTSTYYSSDGSSSYLLHHFSPALVLYLPFSILIPGRWGYAVANFFFYAIGVAFWLYLLYNASKASKKKLHVARISIFHLLWIVILNQLYVYRLGSSYHFEVLVLPVSALFFYFYGKVKAVERKKSDTYYFVFFLILFVAIKEDIAIYLMIFVLSEAIFSPLKNRDSTLLKNFFLRYKQNSLQGKIVLFSIFYFVFAIWFYPAFLAEGETVVWMGELAREYAPQYKKVEGLGKIIRTYFELSLSGGLGILLNIPASIGWGLIYLIHAMSTRPWHHEVYAYYCYSMIPFILYSGLVWLNEKKAIPIYLALIILGLMFGKNALDPNYPLHANENLLKAEVELRTQVKNELLEMTIFMSPESKVFSQYNLSFFIPKAHRLYPLSRLGQAQEFCSDRKCYAVFAPEFTTELLTPKARIESYREQIKNKAKEIYKGRFVELWELN